jgi:hypothetical protein
VYLSVVNVCRIAVVCILVCTLYSTCLRFVAIELDILSFATAHPEGWDGS